LIRNVGSVDIVDRRIETGAEDVDCTVSEDVFHSRGQSQRGTKIS